MYQNYVNPEQAMRLLSNQMYGVSVDAYGNVCLAPIIKSGSKLKGSEIQYVSKAVNIHNHPVLVADGIVKGIWEHVFGLRESERGELEKMLGFEIPHGVCGIVMSPEKFKDMKIKIASR